MFGRGRFQRPSVVLIGPCSRSEHGSLQLNLTPIPRSSTARLPFCPHSFPCSLGDPHSALLVELPFVPGEGNRNCQNLADLCSLAGFLSLGRTDLGGWIPLVVGVVTLGGLAVASPPLIRWQPPSSRRAIPDAPKLQTLGETRKQ